MNDIDLRGGLDKINKNLEQITIIFRLDIFQMWKLLDYLGVESCLNLNFKVFLHLDHDVPVDCLSLIQGFVLMELQYDGNLCLVSHRQDETLVDVLVVDVVAI